MSGAERALVDQFAARSRYAAELCPRLLPTSIAVYETLLITYIVSVMFVIPLLGFLWLSDQDNTEGWRLIALVGPATLLVAGLFQVGRVFQDRRCQAAAMRRTFLQMNESGWPPLADFEVAAHPDTSPDRLLELATSGDLRTLGRVGENPNAPPEALVILADSTWSVVRIHAARNSQVPKETLERLADDSDVGVREAARETMGRM